MTVPRDAPVRPRDERQFRVFGSRRLGQSGDPAGGWVSAGGTRLQSPPQEMKPGYYDTPAGLLAPATTIVLRGNEDVEPVFRGITRGLYYKLVVRLMPQDVP